MNGQNEKELLLSVRDLHVAYTSGGQTIHAVNGISFDLSRGASLGLVGETGAGKTTVAKAIMQILPDYATKYATGTIRFKGTEVLGLPEREIHKKNERVLLRGEINSPINPKPGCRFVQRCPYATEVCGQNVPLQEIRPGHFVACCHVNEINGL